MENDILEAIIKKRKEYIKRKGLEQGCAIPQERQRPVTPFLPERGVILEVKKASPSKGDIAPDLSVYDTARKYAESGASAISVLTEENFFKGSLEDLMETCAAVDDFAVRYEKNAPAVLRKDFLLSPEEIEVSYRAGADAVLLIARTLDDDMLMCMVRKCSELGISALLEIRLEDDIRKLKMLADSVYGKSIVVGVNSRDLKDFSIDLLLPICILDKMRKQVSPDIRVVFESGIQSPRAAAFAGETGFAGLLLGEAAARNPEGTASLVNAFMEAKTGSNSERWIAMSKKIEEAEKPLVKVCGFTNIHDALLAADLGADFLGFIFSASSPRNVDPGLISTIRTILDEPMRKKRPAFVGVITECDSQEAQTALKMAAKGELDFIQLHGTMAGKQFFPLWNLPHFPVVNIEKEEDIAMVDTLLRQGEPRILIDAKRGKLIGGTGKTIDAELCRIVRKKTKLWLAGGVSPENVASLIETLDPELLDVNSGVEKSPGIKDVDKMKALFDQIKQRRK